jgi:baculoviral IAP repeat-containing protein 6
MIFTEDPWRNEPAFTSMVGEHADRKARNYVKFVQPLTVRFAMLDWLQKDQLRGGIWGDVVKTHFSLNEKMILQNVEKWSQSNPEIRKWVDMSGRDRHNLFRSTASRDLLQELRESLARLRRPT